MRILMIAIVFLSLAGCGAFAGGDFPSLTELQPKVESVTPEDGSIIAPDARLRSRCRYKRHRLTSRRSHSRLRTTAISMTS
jgi:hypothetical protein